MRNSGGGFMVLFSGFAIAWAQLMIICSSAVVLPIRLVFVICVPDSVRFTSLSSNPRVSCLKVNLAFQHSTHTTLGHAHTNPVDDGFASRGTAKP